MSADHELKIERTQISHDINFINFLENINKRAFSQKAEITQITECGTQKYGFELDGKELISIQNSKNEIVVKSGTNNKYSVVINPNFRPPRENPDNEGPGLDLNYVIRSIIVEGLFPGKLNKNKKSEMYRAITDETGETIFSFEESQ